MNNPPEWATHVMTNPLTGGSYWWGWKWYQWTAGGDTSSNYFPKEVWERAGWTFEEINIQLEND